MRKKWRLAVFIGWLALIASSVSLQGGFTGSIESVDLAVLGVVSMATGTIVLRIPIRERTRIIIGLFGIRTADSSRKSDIEHTKRRSFVVDLLLPIKLSSDLHANLDEVEPLWIAAHGMRRARWIRRSQEFQAIGKYWASPVRQAFQAVLKVIR